tara:strand:- start:1308 stop:1529 length:222 start_codon:yes stop_codon:yes gene_type:complete
MTKFILIIQVCSFLTGVCKPTIENTVLYNSWNECVVAAHIQSMNLLQLEGMSNMNEFRLATKYDCIAVQQDNV